MITLGCRVNRLINDGQGYCTGSGSGFHEEVTSRVIHFVGYFLRALSSLCDTFVASVSALGSIITLGKNRKCVAVCVAHLESTPWVVSSLFYTVVSVVNPKARFTQDAHNKALITSFVREKLNKAAKYCREYDNVIISHVVTRFIYLFQAVICLVTRIIDFVVALFIAFGAFYSRGDDEDLNSYALGGLGITALISDILAGVIKTINPWAGLVDNPRKID